MSEIGHNSGEKLDPYQVTAAELRQFVERVEHLEAEKKDISEQIKEVYAEAKGRGYDTKGLRESVRRRKMDPDERAERDAIRELYDQALLLV